MNKQNLSPERFIKNAVLQTVSLQGSDVQLYVPDLRMVQEVYQRGEIPFPFWSKVWPAAIALSEFVIRHPSFVQDKKVLELGGGLGLPSLAAASFAADVLCTDHAPEAVSMAMLTAQLHQLKNFHTALLDWNHLPEDLRADVVLLSDINYEPTAFAALMKMIDHFLGKGATLLLSTPQRLMAKEFVFPLLEHCIEQEEIHVGQPGNDTVVTVMVLQQ